MQFQVDFELTDNYVGPLDYIFFGDDDMWVFLSEIDDDGKIIQQADGQYGKLVCDIGGVHPSVGEYVNLWDYIAPGQGPEGVHETKKYRLSFFYTERGASGSTCWMQFTLPTVVGLDLEELLEQQVSEDTGSLWIQKELSGIENNPGLWSSSWS